MAKRGRPRLDRAREDTGLISVEDMVTEARPFLKGWILTLGEAGAAKTVQKGDETEVTPGNVQAAVAGLKILQDYLEQTQRTRAARVMEKAAKARAKAVDGLKELSRGRRDAAGGN